MHTVTLVSAFVLVVVVLLTAPPNADAECCKAGEINVNLFHRLRRCGDCSIPTPYCGHGKCNIFGCNCEGGCRLGRCYRDKKRSVDEQIQNDAQDIISSGDVNGDGVLSINEAETLLLQGPAAEHRRSVRSLDKNMDGLLSADEIDN